MSLDDITDVRQKAAVILSGRKLQMLEEAGLAVVERRRLEALERLAQAAMEWRNSFIGRPGYEANSSEALARHFRIGDTTWALARAIEEVEAMERGNT